MRRSARMQLPGRQRGMVLLVLLALFATTAAYMLASSLNKGSVALSLARADKNRAVMQEARAALIAWAASETLQGGTFQPGALPCPDRNNDGYAESSCGSSNRLGRLPYKTLGIGELRDASGEVLWYGLSKDFRRSTSNEISGDTQGTLSISGLAPASNVIAVVLAPGSQLGNQDRSPSGTSCNNSSQACNTASNYLEDTNGIASTTSYIAKTENLTDTVIANLFNDQLLAIAHQDLFAPVEPVVAAAIERDIVRQYIYDSDPGLTDSSNTWSDNSSKRNKSRYYDAWGGFPFAAPFANPGSSSYTGVTATYEGLLPVVDSLDYYWTEGSGSVVQTGGSGSITSSSCSTPGSPKTILRCVITSSGFFSRPSFRMSGTVAGVGLSFVQLSRLSDVSTSPADALTRNTANYPRTISGSLGSNGAGTVMLDATIPLSFFGTTITVDIRNDNLITSPLISTTDGIAGWFNSNEWYKQSYYAVSPGYAPGGAGTCNPLPTPPTPPTSPSCLGAANLAPPYANPTTDARAILILGGRSLSGTARPNGTLSDYLEAENTSTGDYRFEHSLGKTTKIAGPPVEIKSINDRVIVIAQ